MVGSQHDLAVACKRVRKVDVILSKAMAVFFASQEEKT
jgi:hypothetical protein